MLACLHTSFIKDDTSRRRHLTDKFDDWVEHLNAILARGAGIWTIQSSKVQMSGGGGVLKFRVDRRIIFGVLFVQIKSIIVLECSVTLVEFLITFLKLTSCRIFLNFLPLPELSWAYSSWNPQWWWRSFCPQRFSQELPKIYRRNPQNQEDDIYSQQEVFEI